ncbi:hypothetical protein BDN70DRAFT_998547 [Pholiota conissans]|uniref:C2H2-type domain-containing protein n=1 Tax=Pholiota conissans TaxID=109636 RepID=A0A9P5YKS2_9AGAR|nr:hypothetical protein BDN70DRAFT_998547 [Pholiota conissans]
MTHPAFTFLDDGSLTEQLDSAHFDSDIPNISIEEPGWSSLFVSSPQIYSLSLQIAMGLVHSNEDIHRFGPTLRLPPDMFSGQRHLEDLDYNSCSDYSPSTSFRSLSPAVQRDECDLDSTSPVSPQAFGQFNGYADGRYSTSSEFLMSYPVAGGLRRSQSNESLHSLVSNNTSASGSSQCTAPSSLGSSMERLGSCIDSLAIESTEHDLMVPSPSTSERSTGVSISDMLRLLVESGSSLASKDPDDIRKEFITQLMLSGNNSSDFSRPAKKEIGTAATLKASKLRRKAEAVFVCELCAASFTRKNGVMNHYRSHLGIADKRCMYCKRGFTTSLGRHIKKCKSNPGRGQLSPKKEIQ